MENQSFYAEKALVDESDIYDVCDHSTVENLMMSDAIVDSQDGSGVGSGDVVFGLVKLKLEEPCRKNNSS